MKRVGQILRENLVSQIKEGVEKKKNVFVLSYTRMANNDLISLRKSLRDVGAKVIVSRNSIARLALKDLKKDQLAEKISGQTAFVWSDADSLEITKVIVKFIKKFEQLAVQGGLLDGSFVNQNDLKKLSELPSRQVLLAQLLGTIQSPVSRLMGALNGKSRELLSILKQLSEKKGGN